jgi:hypothetical protein
VIAVGGVLNLSIEDAAAVAGSSRRRSTRIE